MTNVCLSQMPRVVSERLRGAEGLEEDWRSLARCSDTQARQLLSFELAERFNVLPLRQLHCGRLLLATPLEATAALGREIGFAVGLPLEFEAYDGEWIAAARLRAYRGSLEFLEALLTEAGENQAANLNVPSLLEAIILRASLLAASDIHFQPLRGRSQIRFRLAGLLEDCPLTLRPQTTEALSRRLRVLCELPNGAIGEVAEGGFELRFKNAFLRLRVSLLPTQSGEKIVIRLLESIHGSARRCRNPFLQLGMSKQQSLLFTAGIAGDRGLILASGPTGSGKSTLLSTALAQLSTPQRNVITLEDPVERIIEGASQVELRGSANSTFAEVLPKLLRQDPDVLMISEIRDKQTARTACEAALTASLVLSTVHASSALQCITRLLQLGIEASVLCSSLRLLSSQRLLPLLCSHCKRAQELDAYLSRILRISSKEKVFEAVGCSRCEQRGTLGRISVFEMIPIGDSLQQELLSGPLTSRTLYSRLREKLYAEGQGSIADAVRGLFLEGRIGAKAALEALGIRADVLGV